MGITLDRHITNPIKTMNSGAWWKIEAINMNHFSRCSACKCRAVDGVNCSVKKKKQFARPQFLSSGINLMESLILGEFDKLLLALFCLSFYSEKMFDLIDRESGGGSRHDTGRIRTGVSHMNTM